LENPFGFLDTMKEDMMTSDNYHEDGEEGAPKTQFEAIVRDNEKRLKVHENRMLQNVDNISINIANKLGLTHVPWFTLTKIVLGIYSILTCFVLFFRTDFINLTICTTAIYMILNTDKI
jgi:hypothetical protein